MTIEDRWYRHYTCDALSCDKELDTETDSISAPFTTFRVDWGAYDVVLVGTFCEPHAERVTKHLLSLGFEKKRR